jgi:hypothetical protein
MAFDIEEVSKDVGKSFSGKGFKLNRGTLLIIGTGVIALFVLFRQKQPQQAQLQQETIPDVQLAGYPTMNEQDLNSTFASYSSGVLTEVQGTLDDYHNDMMKQIGDIQKNTYDYINDVQDGLQRQLGTDPATVEKKSSTAWTIGYGLTGEGNPNQGKDFSKDRTALKEEIDRTLSVIQYREGKGLDITAQNAHLNNLRKI